MKKDIEQEIQARVEFKMNEFITGVKNRIKNEYGLSILSLDSPSESQKHTYYKEAFQDFLKAAQKEIQMGTPSDDMYGEKKREAKDRAVDQIMDQIEDITRGSRLAYEKYFMVNKIVTAVEGAQNF